MAIFNPQVSNQEVRDPNYLGYSRVVDAPPGDQSTGMALKSVADVIPGVISAVDTSIKRGIENKAYELIDPERDQMTSALEKVKQQTAPQAGTPSLLDANASMDAPSVPDGVDQGIDRITQLTEARKAMKINDTQYSGNVLSIAKQLRAQYPGYRDYVDEQVSKVSGLPVANAYYKNLMEDINRQLVQAQGKTDKVEGLYLKNLDVPNITSYWWPAYKKGDVSEAQFIQKISDFQNIQTQYKIDAAKRSAATGSNDDLVKTTTESFVKTAAKEVDMGLNDMMLVNGTSSTGALVKYITDAAVGKHPEATSVELDQRKTQLAGAAQAQYLSLWRKAHEVGEDGKSVASVIGEDAVKKNITDIMQPLTTTLELANSKDSSPAFLAARQNQAIADEDKNKLLINKDKGAAARQIVTARAIYGDQTFPQVWTALVGAGVKDPFLDTFTQEGLAAVAPIKDVRGEPVPRYMKDAIQHGKSIAAPPEYFGAIPDIMQGIANPKVPLEAKDKLVDWAFNPKNIGRLNELKMEYRDPRTNEIVPGKYRMFNLLGSDKIIQGVAETAKVKPENYQKFQSTLEQEFGTLFRTDIVELGRRVTPASISVDAQGQPLAGTVPRDTKIGKQDIAGVTNTHLSWNDDSKAIGLVDNKNRPITRENLSFRAPNYSALSGTLDILDRVNGSVKTLAKVQNGNPDGTKLDTSSYIFKTLRDSVSRGDLQMIKGMDGVPEQLMKSIFKSRKPEATPEDLDNMLLKFSNDAGRAPGPSVSQFVSNPTGVPLPKRPPGQVVGPNETITGVKNDDIPAGMSVSDFIKQLKREGRY